MSFYTISCPIPAINENWRGSSLRLRWALFTSPLLHAFQLLIFSRSAGSVKQRLSGIFELDRKRDRRSVESHSQTAQLPSLRPSESLCFASERRGDPVYNHHRKL
ncbi:hypothetical protein H6P81_020871 [Aristolochia fimbriata]|uniref:Uncharacterized protein n=1 Tax=Aristolochia fimbriata TaxID=158543 RepID=A0AAV7DWU0_ARIFI|nr:hypothetical protein H6P81_020871 [Aristolochia fimbriata]